MTQPPTVAPKLPVFVDSTEFARNGEHLAAREPIAELPRLASSLFDGEGEIDWHLDGRRRSGADGSHEDELLLGFSMRVAMVCRRCLGRVELMLQGERIILLVADETLAEQLDEQEEDRDVLATSRGFDVRGLVEDEAILQLPFSAAHEHCEPPGERLMPAQRRLASEILPTPFAMLANLRRKPP
jgi:uncharacterized protein